eukprot:GHVP01049263.1.p1 GENE.GHVP01049263.1~~GHVP01049263.1.p1  ORF type:complete len:228 (+),score=31.82 GHVP01049263.1:26-685(+)
MAKSKVKAGLAGSFLMAVNGGASNSTTFETNEAHCQSLNENFTLHGNGAGRLQKNVGQQEKKFGHLQFFSEEDQSSQVPPRNISPRQVCFYAEEDELSLESTAILPANYGSTELADFIAGVTEKLQEKYYFISDGMFWQTVSRELGNFYFLVSSRSNFKYVFQKNGDNSEAWPKTISIEIEGTKAKFDFNFPGTENFSTGYFEYENYYDVKTLIQKYNG